MKKKRSLNREAQTGSSKGHFKRKDKHPAIDGLIFAQYSRERERWVTEEKMEEMDAYAREYGRENGWMYREEIIPKILAKEKEKARQRYTLARLNRRAAMKDSDLSEVDKSLIVAFYTIRDVKNRAHGCIMYHVDHRIPLAKSGTHHPSNLQLATASWNLRKGKKLSF